jgi:two-component sensor histidine kinase/PAS domain-containing protein
VSNELVSLRMLSLGEVDAAVVDMASASHIIQSEGIGNLRVAGDTGFSYSLSLASRSDWPLLNRILEKGLAEITDTEAQAIRHDWITLEQGAYVNRLVWIGVLILLVVAGVATVGVTLWNRSLVRMVAKRSRELSEELAERRQAEDALRLSERRLLEAQSIGRIGDWEFDPQKRIFTFSKEMFELFERDPTGEPLSLSEAMEYFAPENIPLVKEYFRHAFATGVGWEHETAMNLPSGRPTWHRSIGRAVIDDQGKIIKIHGVTQDITRSKQAEDSLRHALSEKETLIRELYHRTKNNLQIVRSLMNLQASDVDSPETQAIVKEMDNRIRGLALVHEMLYRSGDLSQLNLTEYLETLVRQVILNLWGLHSPVSAEVTGEPLPVTLDIASPCGLVINELLSNTFKYAFPDGRNGDIIIRTDSDGPENLLLEYADTGVGLPEGFDPRSQETLGMQSIFAIVEQQLGGEVSIENADGLRWVMRIAVGHYTERV